jgi:hypothetical protein
MHDVRIGTNIIDIDERIIDLLFEKRKRSTRIGRPNLVTDSGIIIRKDRVEFRL